MKFLVTGGAGFIGSHIVDRLMADHHQVVVLDNFSTGRKTFIKHHLGQTNFQLVRADLKQTTILNKAMQGVDFVFHMAGHADVRSGFIDHQVDHIQNLEMTQNVLEAMVKNQVKKIAFASSSSVYGDAAVHPTPENYPLAPTSLYGATKAAAESYIQAYSAYYDWTAYIFRFVSFIGERYTHGIIFDLLQKLQKNDQQIELFSDGTPRKSSLYVQDGVEAMMTILQKNKTGLNIYNLGHDEILTVKEIAATILDVAGHPRTRKKWLGKKSNWKGDNEYVHLATAKLKKLGWKPRLPVSAGITKTVEYLQLHPEFFTKI